MSYDPTALDPKLFRFMAEQVRDYAVFLLDLEGRVMSWNAGARLVKGYDADEIIGRHFSVFYTEEAVKSRWPQHELEVATREGRFQDEGWRVRKDGSRFWASVVLTALRDDDGKLVAFSKITLDLTERRLEDEALRQSEERFRLLIEGVVDYAIYMLDPEGVVTSWNTGAERIKGYKREEIIGKHVSNFYTAEDVQAGKPWEELATARRDGRAEDEGWRVRKNGEKFMARVVVNALYDTAGHLRGFAKVTQDLTQRQRAMELEAASRQVNEFIAMLAHEIRNPLAPIRNAVQIMDRLELSDPAQVNMRRTIDRQSAHLARIADDMIDISRITRGALEVEKKVVEIDDVVSRAIEVSSPAIEAARHELHVDLPPRAVCVNGDVFRLTQVLSNLLNNSARYTPAGGSISLRVREEDGQAVIRVRDTGRGIDPSQIDTLFQMFVRGRTPLQRVGEGLGVGLALARNIVELHGGTIDASSEGEGKGAEFIVRLPLAQADAIAARKQPQVAQPASRAINAHRVLIVDDNVDAAETLNVLLRSLGHETRVVYEGAQALEIADEFKPDVVLLDIGLPGINGYEVARRLRSRAGRKLRIVAITGWGMDEDRKRSAEAGFDVHLVKPVRELDLRQILETNGHPGNGTVH